MSAGNIGYSEGRTAPASVKREAGHRYKWLVDGIIYVQKGRGVNNVWEAEGSAASVVSTILVWDGILNQTFPSDPTVSILENTLGDIVWTRISNGYYRGTLTGAFTNPLKVKLVFPGTCGTSFGFQCIYVEDDDTIAISTSDNNGFSADNQLFNASVRIEIHP